MFATQFNISKKTIFKTKMHLKFHMNKNKIKFIYQYIHGNYESYPIIENFYTLK